MVHLVPRGDPYELLHEVVQMIPHELLRNGSYATVRTRGRDEDLERVVPLAGEPRRQADVKVRKPLSFGMISGGHCADNKGLRDYLDIVWKRARELPDRSQGAASLIVIWYVVATCFCHMRLRNIGDAMTLIAGGYRQHLLSNASRTKASSGRGGRTRNTPDRSDHRDKATDDD
jgi:hypothetical protein